MICLACSIRSRSALVIGSSSIGVDLLIAAGSLRGGFSLHMRSPQRGIALYRTLRSCDRAGALPRLRFHEEEPAMKSTTLLQLMLAYSFQVRGTHPLL